MLLAFVSTVLRRLNNKSAKVRQQAADLTTRLAVVTKQRGEDQLLSKLGLVLFGQLGEEYPDTLGSIIAPEGAIANVCWYDADESAGQGSLSVDLLCHDSRHQITNINN